MSGAIDVLSITTPLPDTSFAVSGVSGMERLSRPYSYTVALHSAGAWLMVPPDQQSWMPRGRVPGAFHKLGLNLAIGTRAWDQQARFIIRVGPRNRAEFEALLPDHKRLGALVSLIRAYVGWEADFAINLILANTEIPALRMAGAGIADAPRLGWTSWLPSPIGALHGQVYADDAMFSATLVESLH